MYYSNLKYINKNLKLKRIYKLNKDFKNRFLFLKYEKKKRVLKFLLKTPLIPLNLKIFPIQFHLFLLKKKTSNSFLKNYCLLTGRSKGIRRLFKMSRIRFREYALQGWLPNIKKSSW